MAGQSRTLKLALLAEVADFTKNINKATTETDNIGKKFDDFGKKAAIAFAVAAGAVVAFAADAVKAAAADEKAQKTLEETIKRTTGATADQVKGVEDYITKTSLAIGITDDELRPAFGRLVRSTEDVQEAQDLVNLSLDIAAATGKPLSGVADALAKAYDGNTTALGKMGTGLDNSIIKGGDVDEIFKTLTGTFGGFAKNEAAGTEKAFDRIKIAADEVKEQIGAALLPVVQDFTEYLLTTVVPAVQSFVDGLTGEIGLTEGLTESQEKAFKWGEKIRKVIGVVIEFKDELIVLAGVIAAVFVISKIATGVAATIALIKTLIVAYNLLKTSAIVAGIAQAFALNPLLGVGAVALAATVLSAATALARNNDTKSPTGPATISGDYSYTTGSGVSALANVTTKKIVIPEVPGMAEPSSKSGGGITKAAAVVKSAYAPGSFYDPMSANTPDAIPFQFGNDYVNRKLDNNRPSVNLTVNQGIVGDPEAAARSVVDVLNRSYFRGTNGANALLMDTQ